MPLIYFSVPLSLHVPLSLIKNSDPLVWGGEQTEVFVFKSSSVILSAARDPLVYILLVSNVLLLRVAWGQHQGLDLQGLRHHPGPPEPEHALEQDSRGSSAQLLIS